MPGQILKVKKEGEPVVLPSVTVVIANHNYSQWVGDALRSVDEQDYPHKKIVIIDDGSTDNSWDVISLLCGLNAKPQLDKPETIAIAQKKNVMYTGKIGNTSVLAYRFDQAGGPSKARNLAFKLAWDFTHLFCILDADDICLPGRISKCVTKFIIDPRNIGLVYTDYNTVNVETGLKIREYKPSFSRHTMEQGTCMITACMISRPALEKAGLYDEAMRVAEDYDLYLRVTEHFVAYHIPEALMELKVGKHGTTTTVDPAIWKQNWEYISKKLVKRLGLVPNV